MNELSQVIETNKTLTFDGPLLLILIWIFSSIVYRIYRQKEIFPSRPQNVLFYHPWGSGHSNRNILTKLGRATRFLEVSVTPEALIIQPSFPFNLMFLPEIHDWEHHILGTNIQFAEVKRLIFNDSVEITFLGSFSGHRSIKLYFKEIGPFLSAIKRISRVIT